MPGGEREQQFPKAEHLVELRSGEIKKELRLGDLVLSQVLYIPGLQWIGTAGKLRSTHLMYWIPAGLYQWAKLRFGDLAGFLVVLNLWATVAPILASNVSQLTDNLADAAGFDCFMNAPAGTVRLLFVIRFTASQSWRFTLALVSSGSKKTSLVGLFYKCFRGFFLAEIYTSTVVEQSETSRSTGANTTLL